MPPADQDASSRSDLDSKTEIELQGVTPADPRARSQDPSSEQGSEEWFSVHQLERDSAVELDGRVEAPTLSAVPSLLRCVEAWGAGSLQLSEATALVPLVPGRVIWADAQPAALALDWAESLADEVLHQGAARVLVVTAQSAVELEAKAWSRATGEPRGSERGLDGAARAVQDPRWTALRARRAAALRYFEGRGLLESSDRVVELAEAVRSWRRTIEREVGDEVRDDSTRSEADLAPMFVLVEQAQLCLPQLTRERLARLALEHSLVLVIVGAGEFAEPSCDTVLTLEMTEASSEAQARVTAAWSAPVLGEHARADLYWDPRRGRLRREQV